MSRTADAIALVVSGALHGAAACATIALASHGPLPLPPFLAVELIDAPTEARDVAPRPVPPKPEPVRPAPRPPRPLTPPAPAPPPEPAITAREIPTPEAAPSPSAPPPVAAAPPTTPETTAAPAPAAASWVSLETTSRETPSVRAAEAPSAGATAVAGPSSPSQPAEAPATSGPAVAAVPPAAVVVGPVTKAARPRGGYQVRPRYPTEARVANAEGTTLLRVHIGVDGSIDDVRVERSAGHSALDRAAAEAVRKWRFEPARSGAVPVAVWVVIPVRFRLEHDF